jgi:hypothetical protein
LSNIKQEQPNLRQINLHDSDKVMNKKSSQEMANEHIESNINTIEDQFEKNNESKTVDNRQENAVEANRLTFNDQGFINESRPIK